MGQNSTPTAYTLQPAPNHLSRGFVECRALHLEDFATDEAARIYITPTGNFEIHTRRHLFQVTDHHALEQLAVIVDGTVPTVIHPGDEYSDPVVEQTPVRLALPRMAWLAAVAVIDHDLENENLAGPVPTPTPPAPPLIDLSQHYLLNVA